MWHTKHRIFGEQVDSENTRYRYPVHQIRNKRVNPKILELHTLPNANKFQNELKSNIAK